MIALDIEVQFDAQPGQIDYATVEHAIHGALAAMHLPVVEVGVDQTRVVDGPFPQQPLAPDLLVGPLGAPLTRPPGARF